MYIEYIRRCRYKKKINFNIYACLFINYVIALLLRF